MALFPALVRLVLTRFRWVFASGDARDAELLALRHQILVLQRQIARPQFTDTDRTILAVLASAMERARPRTAFVIMRPETVLGWHRRLVARHWTQPPPARAPQANAYAERWVRTVRHELLDPTIVWNERQLRRLLDEHLAHHNSHRPHPSLRQRAPDDHAKVTPIGSGRPIRRHTTCDELINEYRTAL